jgi:hypothetical protein
MVKFLKIMNLNFSVVSAFSAVTYLVIFREIRVNSWLKSLYICRESSTNPPFLKKRTQFSPVSTQKQGFRPKTNPIQTQSNPNDCDAQNELNIFPEKELCEITLMRTKRKRTQNEPKLGQSGQLMRKVLLIVL